ncbi:acyclic terpene utilization AtuA family protein [Nonomuraea ferruginea]
MLPAVQMVERGEIDYLCCDHLAELTMSILSKQRSRNPEYGYTRDVLDLLRLSIRQCVTNGVKVITDAGGANPRACAERVAELCKDLGLTGVRIAVVTGDDISGDIDRLMAQGVSFTNMDTGEPLSSVRDRLTHANVYTGADGIVTALEQGADIVICGRVTDIALYLGPLRHEFGWAADDWERLGMATVVAHAIECGGQATGGLYDGGWWKTPGLENLGYPIADVSEDGTAVITKTPGSGGRVDIGTVSEQLVYEILDPANYLTADVTADFSGVRLTEVGPDQVRITGGTGRARPDTLKVNMGYRVGFIGEVQFTYTWPDAYAKARRGIEFLENRLDRARLQVRRRADRVRRTQLHVGRPGGRARPGGRRPAGARGALRRPLPGRDRGAQGLHRERPPSTTTARLSVGGIGTRPPLKELFSLWPCLIPREHVTAAVDILEV